MTENFKKLIRSYEVLGLTPGQASLNDIQGAYRDLVKVWHPDRFANDPKLQHKAQEKMKEINEAYQTIQDAQENPAKYGMDEGGYYGETGYQEAEVVNEEEAQQPPEPPPPTPPPSNPKNNEQPVRPWVRYWARLLDMALLGMPIFFLLVLIFPEISSIPKVALIISFISLPFVMFAEAVVIAIFGNTPAKVILNTKIENAKGEKLSFSEAFKRVFDIYITGMAFGLPFIMAIPMLLQYTKLKKEGKTSWDKKLGFKVVHSHIGGARIAFYVVLFSVTTVIANLAITERKTNYAECMKTYGNKTTSQIAALRIAEACNNIVRGNKTNYYNCIISSMPDASNDMVARAIIQECNKKSEVSSNTQKRPSLDEIFGISSPATSQSKGDIFDVVAAEKAGYSDAEIADYLGTSLKFDVQGARKGGYNNTEIISYLMKKFYTKNTLKPDGKISVYTNIPSGNIDIYIDDEYIGKTTSYFPSGVSPTQTFKSDEEELAFLNSKMPLCGQEGTVSKNLSAGSHSLSARHSDGTYWERKVNIQAGECEPVFLIKKKP